MKKKYLILLTLFYIFFLSTTLFAAAPTKTKLFVLEPAWNLLPSRCSFALNTNAYFKNEIIQRDDGSRYEIAFHHLQNSLQVGYGLSRQFELELKQILYQDHHQGGKGYSIPDDLYLKIKFASNKLKNSRFHLGLNLSSRISLASQHNVILEPYNGGRLTFGLTGLFSYASEIFLPEYMFSFHANLGYLNHADTGQYIRNYQQKSAQVYNPSQELTYGLALVFPSNPVNFSFEIFGNGFIQKPPVTAYARKFYLYFTPSMQFALFSNFYLNLGLDLRLSNCKSIEFYESLPESGLPNSFDLAPLPAWRLRTSISFSFRIHNSAANADFEIQAITPDTSAVDSSDTETMNNLKTLDYDSYRQQIKKKATKKYLEKIQQERIKRDQVLEDLRKRLNAKSKTESKKKSTQQSKKANEQTPAIKNEKK